MTVTTKTAFPPLASEKLPNGLETSMPTELADFDRLRNKFQVCLNRYILMRAMRRKILKKTNYTQSWSPFFDIYRSMEGYLVISLLSFYSSDHRSIQIRSIQTALMEKSNRKLIVLHYKKLYGENIQAMQIYNKSAKKIKILNSRLKHGRISDVILNLKEWRDKEFAHIDKNPVRLTRVPDLGQIDLLFTFTASYILSIETFMIGERGNYANLLEKALNKADRLDKSITTLEPAYGQWIHKYSDQIFGMDRRYGAVFFQKLK